jgi:signal transduction histidine kinase
MRPLPTTTLLTLSVVLVAGSFLANAAYSIGSYLKIGTEAASVLQNAAPSIDLLVRTRTAIRVLDGALDHALIELEANRPVAFDEVDRAWLAVQRKFGLYDALPTYPEEAPLAAAVNADFSRIARTLGQLLSTLRKRDLRAALRLENGLWPKESNRLDLHLNDLIDFHIRHLVDHSSRIGDIWRRSLAITLLLGLLGITLSILAVGTSIRAISRQLEFERARASELEIFAGRIAHDILSPLTAVSLSIGMAERRSDPAVGEILRYGRTALTNVTRISAELLRFARAGARPDRDASCELKPVLDELLAELRPQAAAQAIDLRAAEVPATRLRCPPEVLAIILQNLVRNAIKFMGKRDVRIVELRAFVRPGEVELRVSDSGPGIRAPGVVLFEPFYRGAPPAGVGGVGLGLATVKRLVTAYGGRIGYRRSELGGACFWFTLPGVAERGEAGHRAA